MERWPAVHRQLRQRPETRPGVAILFSILTLSLFLSLCVYVCAFQCVTFSFAAFVHSTAFEEKLNTVVYGRNLCVSLHPPLSKGLKGRLSRTLCNLCFVWRLRQGVILYKNGDKYVGSFENNRRHGEGVHVFARSGTACADVALLVTGKWCRMGFSWRAGCNWLDPDIVISP